MKSQRKRDNATPSQEANDTKRPTIPASDVGVTLRISDKALKELERIQEKTMIAAQEDQKFSWR